MAQYVGFSTKNACKPKTTNSLPGPDGGTGGVGDPITGGNKYRLTDIALVIQDFVNALNIPLGSKCGQPGYGTRFWDFLFEPNSATLQFLAEDEIRRVASQDPRILLNYVKAFPRENGILIEVEIGVLPFQQTQVVSVFFNSETNRAIIQ